MLKPTNYVGLVASLLFLALSGLLVSAADSDPLQDFCVALDADHINPDVFVNGFLCKNPMEVLAKDFKSEFLRMPGNTDNKLGSAVTLASASTFGALNTQGLSVARIDYAPKGGLNAPHVHPRAAEVLFLAQGTLLVGFVDTNNTLFAQTLNAGDLFVFPRGLVHFQINLGDKPAMAIGALNSENPGRSTVAQALFAADTPLPSEVLETAFGIEKEEVDRIIQGVQKTL